MSNVIYSDNLYNPDIKESYLKIVSSSSMERIFKVSAPLEEFYNKDLYEFSREEIKKLLFTLNPSKNNASYNSGILISNYMDWAINQGLRESINPLIAMDRTWYKQFVTNEKKYFTEEELNEFIAQCRNPQDAVIIQLLMEGVRGLGNSELLNLKIGDIDESRNLLILNSNENSRELQVSDQCIDLCIKAYQQTEYLKKNGDCENTVKTDTTNLVENDYIIRSSITQLESYQRAQPSIINRRIAVLSKYFDEPSLTPTGIFQSGMLIMAKDIYLEKGEIDFNSFMSIVDTFGLTRSVAKATHYRLSNEFLNVETIKELYKI